MHFKSLEGKILSKIRVDEDKKFLELFVSDDEIYRMDHTQDCCESVYLESIVGDLEDLIGHPILLAQESTSENKDEAFEHATWTFYTVATIRGYVDLRWLGESNGFYSESVDFYKKGEPRDDRW
jgi:hypothetical protein